MINVNKAKKPSNYLKLLGTYITDFLCDQFEQSEQNLSNYQKILGNIFNLIFFDQCEQSDKTLLSVKSS